MRSPWSEEEGYNNRVKNVRQYGHVCWKEINISVARENIKMDFNIKKEKRQEKVSKEYERSGAKNNLQETGKSVLPFYNTHL